MTTEQMRVTLGLDGTLSDAEVIAAYAAYIAVNGSEPLLTLEQVKTYLKIDAAQTEEDGFIQILIAAAQRGVEKKLSRSIGPDFSPADVPVVTQAVQLLIGNWFRNRGANVVGLQVAEMPLAVTWLLDPLRRLSV